MNDAQLHAATTTRGPLAILAGAGSGKTTTITRRIAYQVASGDFNSGEILAVTFTDKAAKEMGMRLSALGVADVRCKTFHAEALGQFHRLSDSGANITASKYPILKSLVASLPPPHKFRSVRDIATEIEWAKNRRVSPENYIDAVGDRKPPIPAEMMARVYRDYEKRKSRVNMLDFEDILEMTIRLYGEQPEKAAKISGRYSAFTVDEYQDVNLLQQTLLDLWIGGRREVCVVGDDYQSIYGFTGASAAHLLGFIDRYPEATSVTLTQNYRSTPQILALANKLVPRLGGTKKELEAVSDEGPTPKVDRFGSSEAEVQSIVSNIKSLHASGVAFEHMAVLYRINARSEDFEEAFSRASIPFQVQDSPFLQRPAAKAVLAALKRAPGSDPRDAVRQILTGLGYDENDQSDGQEATRQADMARILRLAHGYPGTDIRGFMADLISRFDGAADAKGVQLLTIHRAKGKEYEVVFLPRLEESELPFGSALDVIEERRLFYVGITRAKKHLFISWAKERPAERKRSREPSRFLAELQPGSLREAGNGRTPTARSSPRKAKAQVGPQDLALYLVLKHWQSTERASAPRADLPNDQSLAAIASSRPSTFGELIEVPEMTAGLAAIFGVDLLALVAETPPESEGDASGIARVQQDHPQAYKPWTSDEEEKLRNLFAESRSLEEIAETLGRQYGGIRSRLRKLGLIDPLGKPVRS